MNQNSTHQVWQILVLQTLLVSWPLVASTWGADPKPEDQKQDDSPKAMVTYEDHVKPIFREKCFSCHNPDKKNGDLDLTNFTNMMVGGGSGEVIEEGDANASYLYALVSHQDEPHMPPESPRLPDETLATIRDWIDGGAPEHAGSKVTAKKPTFDMVVSPDSLGKPATPPQPARMSLEPVVTSNRSTAIQSLATNPWTPLAAVSGQQQVLLFNTRTMQFWGTLPFPEGEPHVLKFSRNGRLLLAGGGRPGASGRVIVWDIQTGERVIEIGEELDAVLAADISADHRQIALGGPQRVVRVYSTETGELQHELRKHTDWIYSIEFSPDGVLLASSDRSGGLLVWESATGREYLTLPGHTAAVTAVSWRADSNVVASGSEDGTVRLWEMEDGRQIKNWRAHAEGVADVRMNREGQILSCGRDRQAKLWDANGKQIRAFEKLDDLALRIAFCEETGRVIAGDWTGAVHVWESKDGERVGNLTSNPPRLARRIIDAVQALSEAQIKHKAVRADYEAAQQAAQVALQQLKAAQKTQAQIQKDSKANQKNISDASKNITKLQNRQKSLTQRISTLENVVALLNEAADKAEQAASKLGGEDEASQIVVQIREVSETRGQQLAEARTALKKAGTDLESTQKQLEAAKKRVADLTQRLSQTQKQIEALQPKVKTASELAATAKKSDEQARQVVAATAARVDRWQAEIEFTETLTELAEQLKSADERVTIQVANQARQAAAVQRAQAALEKAQRELAEAQQAAENAQSQVSTAEEQVEQVRERILTLRSEKAAAP